MNTLYTAKRGATVPGESGISVTVIATPERLKLIGRFGSNQGVESNYLPNFFAWQIEATSKRAAMDKIQALSAQDSMKPYVALAKTALSRI